MKKLLITSVLLLSSLISFCQESKEKPLSETELFGSQSGKLFEKQFIDIGKVKGINVQVLKITDLINGNSMFALRFEYKYSKTYISVTRSSSLDLAEMDGLIKSIKNLHDNVFPTKRSTYTEITFTSRTGLESGCFYSPDKDKWTCFIQISKYDDDSQVFLSTDDFVTLLLIIEQAQSIMK